MKQKALIILIILLFIGLVVETSFLLIQNSKIENYQKEIMDLEVSLESINNDKHQILAEKVIIQTYEEMKKAGALYKGDSTGLIIVNMEIISNAYTGNDEDIIRMLEEVLDYLNFKMYEGGYSQDYTGDKDRNSLFAYGNTKKYVEICISKYALFDQIGLYD